LPVSLIISEDQDFVMDGAAADGDMSMGGEEDVHEADTQHAINVALSDVWSGLHLDGDDAEEEYDNDAGHEEEEEVGEGEEGGNLEGGYDDWDDDENDLSVLHTLGEDFEHSSVHNGEFLCCFYWYFCL